MPISDGKQTQPFSFLFVLSSSSAPEKLTLLKKPAQTVY